MREARRFDLTPISGSKCVSYEELWDGRNGFGRLSMVRRPSHPRKVYRTEHPRIGGTALQASAEAFFLRPVAGVDVDVAVREIASVKARPARSRTQYVQANGAFGKIEFLFEDRLIVPGR